MKLTKETSQVYEQGGECRDANPKPNCTIHYSKRLDESPEEGWSIEDITPPERRGQSLQYFAQEKRPRELSPLQWVRAALVSLLCGLVLGFCIRGFLILAAWAGGPKH